MVLLVPQVHNSLLNGSLLRSKPDPLRRLGTMCAVEEASSRGPDYASIVVKLFEYGCEVTSGSFDMLDSPAVVCYIDDLVSQNYMDDHAVESCFSYLITCLDLATCCEKNRRDCLL